MTKATKVTSTTPKMKFKKAPGAPKRFKSAFLYFSEYKHKSIREHANNKKIRAAEAAKIVSRAWKELSDADRTKWLELGRQDRERYEREKAAYKGPWKIPDIKDPNAPKKPMSAFLAFGNERRGLIAEANPTLTNTEISSLLSKLWKECPEHMKQAYRDREARERADFKRNFAEWERKREHALVMDYHSGTSTLDSQADDNTSHGSVQSQHLQQQLPMQQQQLQQQLPMQQHYDSGMSSSLFNFQQSMAAIQEEIPTDIAMPSEQSNEPNSNPMANMISDESLDHFLAKSYVWPQHYVPQVIALPTPPTSYKYSSPSALPSRFANYSMDDILQDDELFFEDFSPMQVASSEY